MKKLIEFVKFFIYITMGILVVCTINFQIYGDDLIPVDTLWQILLSGFLTTAVTMLFHPSEKRGKFITFVSVFIHYGLLCIVMIICGHRFGWVDFNFTGIASMLVSVIVVYILTLFNYYLIDLKWANEINKKLREKYGDGE